MKANAEKLYISPTSFEVGENFYSILTTKSEGDIEYVLKDAFIEKAWNWIEDNMLSSNQQDKSLLYYEQFKKYLEG